jgi:hypothetical protein
MKTLTLAVALLVLGASYGHAANCMCGRVWCAQNGIMTHDGKYAVVQITRYDRRMACWCDYDTLAQARAALASQTKR